MKRAGTKANLNSDIFVRVYNTGSIERDSEFEHTLFVSTSGESGFGIYITIGDLQTIIDWYKEPDTGEVERKE
jgi:hypothetical protein